MPSDDMRSKIRRRVRSYTREIVEPCKCFGTWLTEQKNGTHPIRYMNRLFLAIYEGEYVIIIEDKHLDIKSLINDLWDRKPDHYDCFQFCELLLDFISKEHLEHWYVLFSIVYNTYFLHLLSVTLWSYPQGNELVLENVF